MERYSVCMMNHFCSRDAMDVASIDRGTIMQGGLIEQCTIHSTNMSHYMSH